MIAGRILLVTCMLGACLSHPLSDLEVRYLPALDSSPPVFEGTIEYNRNDFKYKWIALGGAIHDDKIYPDMLEVSATLALSETAHEVGCEIVSLVVRNMPDAVFLELANRGTVGLFTFEDKTTIFPEYIHLRDRPECAGTCAGSCSNTCTGDGRKWDSLVGVGGTRATCMDVNFMCTDDDPYRRTTSILVHEFAHTIHQYGLPGSSDMWDHIYNSYQNAKDNAIWDLGSYAMVNHLEYFAEASGTYFNVNHLAGSSGGMSSCGKPSGYCDTEEEARAWLKQQDPMVYEALSFTYSNYDDSLPGNLKICMYP